jgi:hypothetical protein
MAKNGFSLINAEMHVMEPVDLWQRYIDPEFADRAPRRLSERRWDIRTVIEGEVMAAMPGGDWPAISDAEEKTRGDRYAEEIARDFEPEAQIWAIDREELDSAMLFADLGDVRHCLRWTRRSLPPRLSTGTSRILNGSPSETPSFASAQLDATDMRMCHECRHHA